MCTRSYPECGAYGEGATDGECDMDSSAENGNSSDSLRPRRRDGYVPAGEYFRDPRRRKETCSLELYDESELVLSFVFWWFIVLNCLCFYIYIFFIHASLAARLARRLRPSSPGRSSLRTTARGRTWTLLPAVLAPKTTLEPAASRTWGPPCPPGRWSSPTHTAGVTGRNRKCPFFK